MNIATRCFHIKEEKQDVSKIKKKFQPQLLQKVQQPWLEMKGVIHPDPE